MIPFCLISSCEEGNGLMADHSGARYPGLSLRQAAIVAGAGLLIVSISAPFAQFFAFPRLMVAGDLDRTIQNLTENRGLFLSGIFAYLVNCTFDIIVAWALYVLLAPVNRPLSLLTFAACLVYIAMSLTGLLNYVEAFRLLHSPDAAAAIGTERLHAQVYMLVSSYQFDWGFALILFGFVLPLRGYLVARSKFIPAIFGWLQGIAGIGYIAYVLGVYFAPNLDLSILTITFVAEPVFMLWLLILGWRIKAH